MTRAGTFHGPTLLLSDSKQGFHKTHLTLDLSADAEEIIDVSSYLKGLRKISRLAGDDDFFVWAGFNQKLEDLGFLVGRPFLQIHFGTLSRSRNQRLITSRASQSW